MSSSEFKNLLRCMFRLWSQRQDGTRGHESPTLTFCQLTVTLTTDWLTADCLCELMRRCLHRAHHIPRKSTPLHAISRHSTPMHARHIKPHISMCVPSLDVSVSTFMCPISTIPCIVYSIVKCTTRPIDFGVQYHRVGDISIFFI